MNMTIPVPNGSTNHGDPHLLCVPPKWHDFIVFFGANYFAHAATIISSPGQPIKSSISVLVSALFFPASGTVRAIRAMRNSAVLAKDPIERAARAGALVMVTERYTLPGSSSWQNMVSNGHEFLEGTIVYGEYYLPPNYFLKYVNREAPVTINSNEAEISQALNLPSIFNVPKLLISLVQVAWALITIYRSRGNQIDEFGYAAFGLTVVPYAFMSIINIFGNLLTPDYPSVFLIRTPAMRDAERAGGRFPYAIKVKLGTWAEFQKRRSSRKLSSDWIGMIVGLVPLVVIGALSGFHAGRSTSIQRGFTMAWTILGILVGPIMQSLERIGFISDLTTAFLEVLSGNFTVENWSFLLTTMLVLLLTFVPCIGGMVVVGQMIQDFGVCSLLG